MAAGRALYVLAHGQSDKLVCDLNRAKVPSGIIYSIITDPAYKISESILEKGRGADVYAKRQIKNAKVEISDPLLESMNKEHAVIENFGSKTVVITFDDKDTFFHRTFEDFRRSYQNRLVTNPRGRKGNGKPQTHADYFLNHPRRRQYKTVEFLPGKEAPDGVLNPPLNTSICQCKKLMILDGKTRCVRALSVQTASSRW